MKELEIQEIFDAFDHKYEFLSANELDSGHINDTYLVHTDGEEDYILQRINHIVFKDVPGLVQNKAAVSMHIRAKLSHLPKEQLKRKVLSFVKAKNSELYYYKEGTNYWNMMVYINDSYTHEVVEDKQIAYEGGKLFGEFLNLTSDFDAAQLTEVIPKFHDMSYRFRQYALSIQGAPKDRLVKAGDYIRLIDELKEEMHLLQRLKENEKIPIRVTHNDTKISNALFDLNNKGLCVIDTDTVMPGIVHYDFGDAIRTICNTAAEDEKNLDLVSFNLEYYKAYVKGFLKKMRASLSPIELQHLPLAAKTMIFIMAIRFLTDFLNGDVYYKTTYPEHNLDRSKNQFKLIESLSSQFEEMKIE
ncbi:MAG: aminoglycoside phosphotransferase family protein [Flavobacteriaceae bacterium]|nr:aminoglycoside phosphotransferase family protein [Flavobacteriaceae bacterium]